MSYVEEKENKTEDFLNEMISAVRRIVNDDKMINKCDTCQGIIGRYLSKLGIKFYPCSTNKVISVNTVGHSFIVALIDETYYLIDPAFVQFKYDESEEIVIKGLKCVSKSPYYYMNIINPSLTEKLINNGYFKLNEETAYSYGNAFYFTKTNIPSNSKLIPISGDVLMESFKKGDDKLSDYDMGEIDLNSESKKM